MGMSQGNRFTRRVGIPEILGGDHKNMLATLGVEINQRPLVTWQGIGGKETQRRKIGV